MRGKDLCRDEGCGAGRSWATLRFALSPDGAKDAGALGGDGALMVKRLADMVGDDGRGRHAGEFQMKMASGAVVAGVMQGVTLAGDHRKPGAHDRADIFARDRRVGRLTGKIISGPGKGGSVEARYAIQGTALDGRVQKLEIALGGWTMPACERRVAGLTPVDLGSLTTRRDLLDRLATLRPSLARPEEAPPSKEEARREAGTPADAGALKLRAIPRKELPPGLVRPLEELPADAVRAYAAAEGGRLDVAAKRRLQLADRRFRMLDPRGLGVLDRKAFAGLYAGNRGDLGAVMATRFLSRYDRNRDGRLDRTEFADGWEVYGKLDRDRNGSLDVRELSGSAAVMAERAFLQADANGNGLVDFREFALWWRGLR